MDGYLNNPSLLSTIVHVLLQLFQNPQYIPKKKTIMLSFTYFYQNTLNCSLSVSIIMQKYKDPTQPTQKIGYLYNYIRQVCVDLTWQNPLLSKLLYAIQPTIPQCLKRKAGCLNQLCQNYLFLIQKALI